MTSIASIFLMTFVLEDVALVAAAALVQRGDATAAEALSVCFAGISLGDVALYGLGRLARSRSGFLTRCRIVASARTWAEAKLRDGAWGWGARTMDFAIFVSRAVPGTRIPIYVAAGFSGFSLLRFAVITAASVALWVTLAIVGGGALFSAMAQWTGGWKWAIVASLSCAILLRRFLRSVFDRWERRALAHSWRRWASFEFWPAWLFYAPVVPWVAWLAIRNRTWRAAFLVNPAIPNGGWIGESKWAFLSKLRPDDPATVRQQRLCVGDAFPAFERARNQLGLSYPVILKPDVGQRGYGVRLIRTSEEANDYLERARGDLILQEASSYVYEAGLFYARRPGEDRGRIISVTDKEFPRVIGDGSKRLGDLILADSRARIIAPIYFARHRERLDEIVAAGVEYRLSECGNHCQGAIFKDGRELATEALARRLDEIAKGIPGFYFGRFDVRYRDPAALMRGEGFHILEINGAGSESTHIWDARTRLIDAYRALFAQWRLLFAIGLEVLHADLAEARRARERLSIRSLVLECLRVWSRRDGFSVSS